LASHDIRDRARTTEDTDQDTLFTLTPPRPADAAGFSTRPYQVRGVNSIVAGLRAGGRGQARSACGTGKTAIAQWSAERLIPHGGVVVIVAPTIGLVAQTLAAWNAGHKDHLALAVCGDTTVTDDSYGSVDDILDTVTTDSDVIDAWLRRPITTAIRLIVGTHASAHVIGEGLQKADLDADLLVIDEAHRSSGWIGKHTALLHDDDVLPAVRRLYMTATARIFDNSRDGASTFSMDDESVFGPVLFNYPFSQAIDEGYLDDYRLAVIGVTRAEVLAVLRRTAQAAHGRSRMTDEHTAMVQAATARAAAELGLRRVIAFCPRVEDAQRFADTFEHTLRALPESMRPQRRLHATHVRGSMRQARRREVLATLAHPPHDGWTVIANAKCLSEGIDVPTVDGVVFTAPKNSTVDIVQAIGRALRRDPEGSGTATIIVPILLTDDTDDDLVDAGAYDTLWQVVRGLRAHDDTFSSLLDAQRANKFRDHTVQERITFMMPEGHQSPEFLEHLTIRLVKGATSKWWDGYAHLADFHAREGHCLVNHRYCTDDGFPLGSWVSATRTAYREQRLAPDRVIALHKIDFVVDAIAQKWERGFAVAAAFHAEHGHLRPPSEYRRDDVTLAKWLGKQRTAHTRGTLSADRQDRLTAIGMIWERTSAWQDSLPALRNHHTVHGLLPLGQPYTPLAGPLQRVRAARRSGELPAQVVTELDALGIVWEPATPDWRDHFAHLADYHSREGHALVPVKYVTDSGFALGAWVVATRQAVRGNRLTTEQLAALDTVDFVLNTRTLAWEHAFTVAAAYSAEHGHLSPPSDFRSNDVALASWLYEQRTAHAQGTLDQERESRLVGIGMTWASVQSWQDALAHVLAFHADNGTLPTKAYSPVSGAMAKLRVARKRGELGTDLIAQLDRIGMTWDSPPPSWWDGYQHLVDFHAGEGHCAVPSDHVVNGDFLLGRWVHATRQAHTQDRLTDEQRTALHALGFHFDGVTARWEQCFTAAHHFHTQHGHLRPPPKTRVRGIDLPDWITRQRRAYREGRLDDTQRTRLDSIGMFWTLPNLWDERLAILQAHHAEHGRLPDDDTDPDVAQIISAFRTARTNGRLDKRFVVALDEMGVTGKSGQWWRGYAHLVDFHAREGHAMVPSRFVVEGDGFTLGSWLVTARAQHRLGELAADRVAALDELGVVYDARTAAWEDAYQVAKAFHAEQGHLRPAKGYAQDGVTLSTWLLYQRKLHTEGTLDPQRRERLDAIGMQWQVVYTTQERLAQLRDHHREHGRLPTSRSNKQLYAVLSTFRAMRERGDLPPEDISALDELGMRWEIKKAARSHTQAPTTWEAGIAAATSFQHRHGHLDVRPSDPPAPGHPTVDLSAWIRKVRTAHSRSELPQDQVDQLDSLGMIWNVHTAAWEYAFAACVAFHAEHGHLRIPNRHTITNARNEPLRLDNWVHNQRANRAILTTEQVQRLDALGMRWTPNASRWEANIAALRAFHAQHGHLDVPEDFTAATGTKLAPTLSNYKTQYRKGTLPEDRARALEALGIAQESELDNAWNRMIDALRTYHAAHGDILVPTDYTTSKGTNVAAWLYTQRRLRADGALTADQIAELDQFGMIWEKGQSRWTKTLARLRAYHSQHGTINITHRQSETDSAAQSLHSLIWRYRKDHEKGSLPKHKVDALNDLGFDWNPANGHDQQWKTSYAEAQAFHAEHGHLTIPKGHVTTSGLRLDLWVAYQKKQQARGELSVERIPLLNSLDITWKDNADAETE